jgi:hypothetical protein
VLRITEVLSQNYAESARTELSTAHLHDARPPSQPPAIRAPSHRHCWITGITPDETARSSCRIGCVGVVVRAGLRVVAERSTGGRWPVAPGVPRRSITVRSHEPCWQIAARMARHVMRRASCPRCPRAASLFAGVGPASRQWRDRGRTARTGPAVPVPGSPGNRWRGVNDDRADRISKMGLYPALVRPGVRASAAAGRWLSSVPGRIQDGSGTVRCSWTQLDLVGHDPEPAPR